MITAAFLCLCVREKTGLDAFKKATKQRCRSRECVPRPSLRVSGEVGSPQAASSLEGLQSWAPLLGRVCWGWSCHVAEWFPSPAAPVGGTFSSYFPKPVGADPGGWIGHRIPSPGSGTLTAPGGYSASLGPQGYSLSKGVVLAPQGRPAYFTAGGMKLGGHGCCHLGRVSAHFPLGFPTLTRGHPAQGTCITGVQVHRASWGQLTHLLSTLVLGSSIDPLAVGRLAHPRVCSQPLRELIFQCTSSFWGLLCRVSEIPTEIWPGLREAVRLRGGWAAKPVL